MAVIYFITFLFSLLLIKKVYKTFCTPVLIISIIWCIFPIIPELHLAGLHKPSMRGEIIILLSYLSFFFTYFFIDVYINKKKFDYRIRISQTDTNDFLNEKFILLGNIIIFLWLITKLITVIPIIQSMGYQYLRMFSADIFGSVIENLIYSIFAKSFVLVSLAIYFYCMAVKKSINVLGFIISLTNIVIDSFVYAGRAGLVQVILYGFFAVFFCVTKERSKRQIFIFYLIGIMLLGIVIFLTNERMGQYSLLDSFFIYFGGPFYVFSYMLDHPRLYALGMNHYMYGSGTFGFIYNTIYSAISVMFGVDYKGSDFVISQLTEQTYVMATNSQRMNSSYTAAYVFLKDFGILGVIWGFAFMAILINIIFERYRKNRCVRYGAMYIILLYVLFKSISKYLLIGADYFMMFLYIMCLTKSSKNFGVRIRIKK